MFIWADAVSVLQVVVYDRRFLLYFSAIFFNDEDEDDVNHGYLLCSGCIPRKYECRSWSAESNEELF